MRLSQAEFAYCDYGELYAHTMSNIWNEIVRLDKVTDVHNWGSYITVHLQFTITYEPTKSKHDCEISSKSSTTNLDPALWNMLSLPKCDSHDE